MNEFSFKKITNQLLGRFFPFANLRGMGTHRVAFGYEWQGKVILVYVRRREPIDAFEDQFRAFLPVLVKSYPMAGPQEIFANPQEL
jgi:hypothetical protein